LLESVDLIELVTRPRDGVDAPARVRRDPALLGELLSAPVTGPRER
jgi:hypothetical protein